MRPGPRPLPGWPEADSSGAVMARTNRPISSMACLASGSSWSLAEATPTSSGALCLRYDLIRPAAGR